MNTPQNHPTGKRKSRNLLFPVIALLGMLGLPLLAWADEAACHQCVNDCYAQLANCQGNCPYAGDNYAQQQCYNQCGNNIQPCFMQCSAGPCSG